MFDVFADKKIADKLAKEDRSFAKKLSSHIGNIISEMKRAIAAFAAGKDKIEIKALYNDIEKLDKIRDMLLEGLDKASENFKARTDKGFASLSKSEKNQEKISYSVKDDISDYNITNWNDYIHIQKRVIGVLKEEKYLGDDNRILVFNNSLGANIELNFKGIKETLGKGKKFEYLSVEQKMKKVATIKQLPEIIKNAVVSSDNENNYHNESSSVKYAYIESIVEIDDKPYNVILDIRKSPHKNMFWVHTIREINQVTTTSRTDETEHRAFRSHLIYENNDITKSNKSQVPKKVESRKDVDDSVQSQEFKNWFGDWQNDSENASKVVNSDGTPKIMYHGSPNSFTAFDKKKAKASGLYGKGFYFTDSESHAGQYGDKYAVYLNIKNPLEPGGLFPIKQTEK